MQEPGVDADHESGTGDMAGDRVKRLAIEHASAPNVGRDALAAQPLGLVPPWQQQLDAALRKLTAERDPPVFRPLLAALGGGVKQDRIRRSRLICELCAIEAEIDVALRRVAERLTGQRAVARDGVPFAADPVAHVVKRARQRLANTVPAVAVTAAACE